MTPEPPRDPYEPPKPGEHAEDHGENFVIFYTNEQGRVCGGRQASEKEKVDYLKHYRRQAKTYREAVLERTLQPDEVRELIAGTATVQEIYARRGITDYSY